MEILLNVGLKYSDASWLRGHQMPPSKAIAAIYSVGGAIRDYAEHDSTTEKTLVARLPKALTVDQLENLADLLDQDCVAQFDGIEGHLVGPKADDWGPFDPSFFLGMNGEACHEPL